MFKEVKLIFKLFKNKKLNLIIITCITIVTSISLGAATGSYIFATDSIPTIIIGNGSTTVEAIFTSEGEGAIGPWYPGFSAARNLRVINQYGSKIKVKEIGMDINLSRNNETLGFQEAEAVDFMRHMNIKIEYKNPIKMLLNGTIYDGDFNGLRKGVDCSVKLNKDDYVDLVYKVSMAEEAEINIAGIASSIDFTVAVEGDTSTGNDSDDKDKDKYVDRDKELIEEPIEVIPDIGSHWGHDCIVKLIEKGIVEGYEDGSIKPENYITRVEAAVLIGKALGLKEDNSEMSLYKDKDLINSLGLSK